jgi:hypothetical protein
MALARRNLPLRERYRMDGKCWTWLGAVNSKGYGTMRYNGQVVCAHRVYYLHYVCPEIPRKFDIHHVCGNRLCVNPSHLQPVAHVRHGHYQYRKGAQHILVLAGTMA